MVKEVWTDLRDPDRERDDVDPVRRLTSCKQADNQKRLARGREVERSRERENREMQTEAEMRGWGI